jgi:malate synthase
LGQASQQERTQLLEAIFDLSREELQRRVQSGAMGPAALAAHDYIFDIFPERISKEAVRPQGTVAV